MQDSGHACMPLPHLGCLSSPKRGALALVREHVDERLPGILLVPTLMTLSRFRRPFVLFRHPTIHRTARASRTQTRSP